MATKKTTKKDPLKSKTEWTISEFQMWLHGAYSLQGENWVPNEEQWNMIVDIIYKLKDRGLVKRPTAAPGPVGPVLAPPGYGSPEVAPGPAILQPEQANPTFNPDPVPPEAGMSLSQLREAADKGTLNSGQKAVKTANIDTSKGYTSSFG